MVLPEGFALPPPRYLGPVVAALVLVTGLLWRRRPPVTDGIVAASVPWMVAGAGAHVLHQLGALPDPVAPLFGVPMVYLTLATVAGATWLASDHVAGEVPARPPAGDLLLGGTLAASVAVGLVLWHGHQADSIAIVWPAVSVVATGLIAGTAWIGLRRWRSGAAEATGLAGALVLASHTLDGVTTVVGLDVLDGAERSPLVDALIGVWGDLPTAEVLGEAWPFVPLKVALALVIIALVAEPMEESPSFARLLMIAVAALGLAPGVNNLLLFLVGG